MKSLLSGKGHARELVNGQHILFIVTCINWESKQKRDSANQPASEQENRFVKDGWTDGWMDVAKPKKRTQAGNDPFPRLEKIILKKTVAEASLPVLRIDISGFKLVYFIGVCFCTLSSRKLGEKKRDV